MSRRPSAMAERVGDSERPDSIGTRHRARASSSGGPSTIPDARRAAARAISRDWRSAQRGFGASSSAATPLLRDGVADRCISVVRDEVAPVHRAADRAAGDVRGPGRDRHRERPPVPGAGAATCASGRAAGARRGRPGRLSSLDLQEVLTTIVAHAVRLSGPTAASIYEYDEADGDVRRCGRPIGCRDELLAAALRADAAAPGRGRRSGGRRWRGQPVQVDGRQPPRIARAEPVRDAAAVRAATARCWRCRCCARSACSAGW